jgi:pimeloyl-ACP methyl ester carboxylesterase
MRWRRFLLRAGAAIALLGCLGGAAIVCVGPSAIVTAPNRGVPAAAASKDACEAIARVAVGPPAATLAVQRHDPAGAPLGTMFVLHGIRDRKESMSGWAKHLTGAGYRVFTVDSRGHGASSGDWLTYGVQESRDLSQLIDQLQGCVAGPVGVMGISYGGATAIEWAAREPRVKAAVSVASFSSLRAVVPLYFRRMFPVVSRLVPSFVMDATVSRSGRMAGFNPDEANPLAAIAQTRTRMLLVHGRADIHIPPGHSEALHAAAQDHSSLLLLDGEDHLTISEERSGRLWSETFAFLARAFSA